MIPTLQLGQVGRSNPLRDTDPLFSQVVLLLQGGSLTDQSSYARTVTSSGVTTNDSTWVKNGFNTLKLVSVSGTQGYLTWSRTPSELLLSTVPFCFEGWFKFTNSSSGGFHYYNDGVGGAADAMSLAVNNSGASGTTEFRKNAGSAVGAGPSLTIPNEAYFCAERVGDNLYVSINGSVSGPTSLGSSFSFNSPSHDTRIGQGYAVGGTHTVHIGQLRLTIGASRYGGSSFTPPSTLFPTA